MMGERPGALPGMGAGAAPVPRVHIGCGGVVLWDLSGGYCTRCHAEGLEPDDAERGATQPRDPAN